MGYELVQKIGDCCPLYECVCDTSLCNNAIPKCEKYHEPTAIGLDSCCPEYQCVCQSHLCPTKFCGVNERKIRINDVQECCPEYRQVIKIVHE